MNFRTSSPKSHRIRHEAIRFDCGKYKAPSVTQCSFIDYVCRTTPNLPKTIWASPARNYYHPSAQWHYEFNVWITNTKRCWRLIIRPFIGKHDGVVADNQIRFSFRHTENSPPHFLKFRLQQINCIKSLFENKFFAGGYFELTSINETETLVNFIRSRTRLFQ